MNDTLISETEAKEASKKLKALCDEINRAIFGQENLVKKIAIALVARGNVLLEGLPGLGKTELVKSFAATLGLDYRRVQFTPDLLPGDITGNPILQEENGKRLFVFQAGPVFTNLLLADEINRASPKTQSALLEAMQERCVSVMGETRHLPKPFFVLATQNPIELEGTYPLPEAQVDRFLFKLEVLRASAGTLEKIICGRKIGETPALSQVLDGESLIAISSAAENIFLHEKVVAYIAALVTATHPGESKAAESVVYGASPRAAIGIAAAARSLALLEGRTAASFEDVRAVAPDVLRHRIVLHYQAKMEGKTSDTFIAELLAEILPGNNNLPKTLSNAKI